MPAATRLCLIRNGSMDKSSVDCATPHVFDSGMAPGCNTAHRISADGTQLGMSDNSQQNHESLVYIVPIGGGTPRRITQKSPSYLHGWSPDGKTLAFVGQRNGDIDIYTIPAED